jgi:methionyl-tRNA formyltransferase
MRIGILCSNNIAIPMVQLLMKHHEVVGIGVPESRKEVRHTLEKATHGSSIRVTAMSGGTIKSQLIEWLDMMLPDIVLVATFPFRIPTEVFSVPTYGFLNLHFGLLPEMRGPDPVFESIRRQKSTTGATIHVIDSSFDTGPIVKREEFPLPPHFTYGMLSAKLAHTGAEMALTTLNDIHDQKTVVSSIQDETNSCYYPALSAQHLAINWTMMNSREIIALVNSMNPVSRSGTPTSVNGWNIGICYASLVNLSGDTTGYIPGTIITADQQNGLLIFTKDNLAVKAETIYTEEGYFPGYILAAFGIQQGMIFGT